MPMRRCSAGMWWCASLTHSPSSVMLPSLARSSPATARSRVVLPQPEGPINTPMSPARRVSETPSTAASAWPG